MCEDWSPANIYDYLNPDGPCKLLGSTNGAPVRVPKEGPFALCFVFFVVFLNFFFLLLFLFYFKAESIGLLLIVSHVKLSLVTISSKCVELKLIIQMR